MYKRNRVYYSIFLALVIIAGCSSRSPISESWPIFIVKYAGDTLWALMLFLGLGILFTTLSTAKIAAIVLFFAFGVEFSQLYSADWIVSFRNSFIGAVTIGSGFLWSDFACYTVGCLIGVTGEVIGNIIIHKR